MAVIAAAIVSGGRGDASENYPTRPVTMIVPFSAAGPNDVAGRLVAPALGKELGQNVVVENRPGAGGVPGTEYARQRQDGYTLLMGGIAPLVLIPPVQKVPYDLDRDFVPLGLFWRSPQVLAVHPKLNVKSLSDFVALAKKRGTPLVIGSAGQGTVSHLANELLRREAKIEFNHVPYRSSSNSLTDLLGGHIDAIFGDVSLVKPTLESGQLIGIAVTSPKRSPVLPGIPAMAEAGYPRVQTEVWYGLLVSSKAPRDAVERLKAAVLKVQNDPEVRRSFSKYFITIDGVGSEHFAQFLQEEEARWTPIVQSIKRE
jgi:tripartite-type tricarboxylate transporter receptor subunit TctC